MTVPDNFTEPAQRSFRRFRYNLLAGPFLAGDQEVTAMMRHIERFATDESGATAIEYGLIAAGIAVVMIAAVQGLGLRVGTTFNKVTDALPAS